MFRSSQCHKISSLKNVIVESVSSRLLLLPRCAASQLSAHKDFHNKPNGWMPKMVIFDKHGTLLDFHATWTPWVQRMISRLQRRTNLDLTGSVYECLDVCRFTNKTRTGVLAQGTNQQLKDQLQNVLVTTVGLPVDEAERVIDECFVEAELSDLELRTKAVKPITEGVTDVFNSLKMRGIKIGVCTSDDRMTTEMGLNKLDLLPLVDVLVCGDDPHIAAKPHPSSIQALCTKVGMQAGDAVLVGDQPTDMLMGSAAGTAYNVGVLSGVGTRLELTPPADYIIPSVSELLPLLLDYEDSQSTSSAGDVRAEPSRKASLVIFDKDGTLINFESMWTPWAVKFIEKLESETGLDLYHKCLAALGYCHQSNKWRAGVFAEGTVEQNHECILSILQEEGMSTDSAKETIQAVWEDGDHSTTNDLQTDLETDPEDSQLETTSDLRVLFESLHRHGVKVAICTADNRKPTEQFLASMKLDMYVDTMVCGDDDGAVPKPAPDNAHRICTQLGIDPAEAIVVGDTIADLGMGRSASLGATIGVLSGVGDVQDLDHTADHMIDHVGQLLPLVLDTEAAQKTHKELMEFTARSLDVTSTAGNTGSQSSV